MSLSLAQIFGKQANQTGEAIAIQKSDLAAVGLTPSAVNSAESLFAAIILLLARNLRGTIATENGEAIATDLGDLEYRFIDPESKIDCYYWDRKFPIIREIPTTRDIFVTELLDASENIFEAINPDDF